VPTKLATDRRQDGRRASDTRLSAAKRGYDRQWRKARETFLKGNPLCVQCLAEGDTTLASVVDHVVPHRGIHDLMWDPSNWQPLCTRCHNRKTGRETWAPRDVGGSKSLYPLRCGPPGSAHFSREGKGVQDAFGGFKVG
jgi:5-methylcytosine-specific restriction protein A